MHADPQVVDATLKGRGFMIGHTALIGDLIEDGQLQTLSGMRVPSKHQFYLLTKAGVPMNDATEAFVEWILDRAAGTTAA